MARGEPSESVERVGPPDALFAERVAGVLVVLQAMDAGGKDGDHPHAS